jgi:hypothetical protein
MLQRIVLLGGMLLVGVIVLSGVALAKDIRGTFKQDDLTDVLFGGSGNDTILAADGKVDQVDCGLGDNDTAYVDELDDVVNCENVFLATPEVTM